MASKSTPKTPKNLQKCSTLVVFMVFASFGKMSPKIQKKSPGCSQKRAKLPILGSKLAILGTSWRQVGQLSAILAHLGAKMRPNSHPNGAPDAQQIASWAILAPRGSPRRSKVLLGPQFSQFFSRILDRIPYFFQAAFFNFQPQVRHGGGLARAAHWISAGPAKRRHGVLNLVSNPSSPSRSLNSSSRHPSTRARTPRQPAYRTHPRCLKPLILPPSSPILAHLRHLCPNILPTRSQLDAKIAQDSLTSGQDRAR